MRIARQGAALALALASASPAAAQHAAPAISDTATGGRVRLAAHGVAIATRASPTAGRQHLAEAYLTQPALIAMASGAGGRLEGVATLNLEGLTLRRGELTTGTYGEGYVDRRHPHAYLHEVIVTARTRAAAGSGLSLSAGRGFAPFGSDDPMVRPFVKYPVNHHLAQLLERALVTVALRHGLLALEAGVFNGDEPTAPGDLPSLDRLGDSWAARVTLSPGPGIELSGSHASVESPEVAAGFGLDARKWHVAARLERGSLYALAEWARTIDVDDGVRGEAYSSALAEVAYSRQRGSAAVRLERTDRPEEVRLENPFRTPPGTGDPQKLGVTRWSTVTAALSHEVARWRGLRAAPFVEVGVSSVALRSGFAFDPSAFYGAGALGMLSVGVRMAAGARHDRMGRYGAGSAGSPVAHH